MEKKKEIWLSSSPNQNKKYTVGKLGLDYLSKKNMPNLKFRKVKNGENVDISCEFCGEPISQTSVKFGMDCKNRCAEKKYRKMMGKNR